MLLISFIKLLSYCKHSTHSEIENKLAEMAQFVAELNEEVEHV